MGFKFIERITFLWWASIAVGGLIMLVFGFTKLGSPVYSEELIIIMGALALILGSLGIKKYWPDIFGK